MAKKASGNRRGRPNKGAVAAQKRWGFISRKVLAERLCEVERLVEDLRNSVSATEIFGFEEGEEFRVDSATQWDRGMALLKNTIEQAHIGIVLHKRDKARGSKWERKGGDG